MDICRIRSLENQEDSNDEDKQSIDPVYKMLKQAIEVRRSTDPDTCVTPMSISEQSKNWSPSSSSSNFMKLERNQSDYINLKPQFGPRPVLRSNPSSSSGGSSISNNLLAVNQTQLATCSGTDPFLQPLITKTVSNWLIENEPTCSMLC